MILLVYHSHNTRMLGISGHERIVTTRSHHDTRLWQADRHFVTADSTYMPHRASIVKDFKKNYKCKNTLIYLKCSSLCRIHNKKFSHKIFTVSRHVIWNAIFAFQNTLLHFLKTYIN